MLCEICQNEAAEGHRICLPCAEAVVRLDKIRERLRYKELGEMQRVSVPIPAKKSSSLLFG